MKREGFIFERIIDKKNIRKAIHNAAREKDHKRVVQRILNNEDYYIEEIHQMIKNQKYKPSPYIMTKLPDDMNNKIRTVHKPKFYPDQVIHWCLMQQIDHLLMRGMYKWSCASIPKRGQVYAMKGIRKWLRTDKRNTRWSYKLDITKYYESVDQELLKKKFRRLIKCERTLNLIDTIIESLEAGLPIGNYTSQWFANFYFQEIDHYIKQELKIKYYSRYMDDIILLGSNKKKLRKAFQQLKEKLKTHNLRIKGNYQLFRVSDRPIDFAGFVFTHDKVYPRKRITRRARRTALRFDKNATLQGAYRLVSYYGWYKHSDSHVLIEKYFNKNDVLKRAKELIGNESRKRLQCHS